MPINNVIIPNTFNPNTTILASQVNGDFDALKNKLNVDIIPFLNSLSSSTNIKDTMNFSGGNVIPPFASGVDIVVAQTASPIAIAVAGSNLELNYKIKVDTNGALNTAAPFSQYGCLADFKLEKSNSPAFTTFTIINPNIDGFYRETLSATVNSTIGNSAPLLDHTYLDTNMTVGNWYYRVKVRLRNYLGQDFVIPSGAPVSFNSAQGRLLYTITT